MINRKEILIFIFFTLFFASISILINYPRISEFNFHFGGEYGNIAAAIVKGEGYTNAFKTNSGSTSWMPPFYTYLLALIFVLFGIKTTLSVYVILALKCISFSIIPVLLFRICKGIFPGKYPFLIIPIYLIYICSCFYTIFCLVHDIWIVMLLITILFYKYCYYIKYSKEIEIGWGILGGIIFLTNPILGVIFVLLTLLSYTKTCWRKKAFVLLIALAVCSPWFIRNYLVFNQVVLVKSNLFFDMYQSNYLDDDGVLDVQTFEEFHPYKNERIREEYTLLGEKKFMDLYRDKLFSELRSQPMTFIGKSANRFLRIFLIYPNFNPQSRTDRVTMTDILIYSKKAIIYPIPFLLSIFFLVHKKSRDNKVIQVAIYIFIIYLLPYIFVGFYNRYRIPLIPIFSVLCLYFVVYLSTYYPGFSRILNSITQDISWNYLIKKLARNIGISRTE